MQSNQTPIVIAILAVGIIITLAIVLTRNNNQDTTEPANVAETEQQTEQETQPTPEPVPAPEPQPTPEPQPAPQPTPPQDSLLANWNSLTDREKTDLNPFDCDHATQWVSAEDGSCINKASEQETNMTPEYILLAESRDCDEPTDFLGEVVQRCEVEAAVAVKGEHTDEGLDAYWTAWEREKAFSWHGGGIVSLVFYEHNGSESIGDYTDTDLLKEYSEDYLID